MEIRYQNIILRDPVEADVENEIRWNTTETGWQVWETPDSIAAFPGADAYRARALEWIRRPKTGHRWSFSLTTAEGRHIGLVNSYPMDEAFRYKDIDDWEAPPVGEKVAVAIFLYEPDCQSAGYGTQALTAFVRYLLRAGCTNLYVQTYSANVRMLGLAHKLGFSQCHLQKAVRQVDGADWDDVTLRLDAEAFWHFLWQETAKAIPAGKYRHFKGKEYRVLSVARHSETLEPMVVYQALYGEGGIWVRPAEMWNEWVERESYAGPRFQRIGD